MGTIGFGCCWKKKKKTNVTSTFAQIGTVSVPSKVSVKKQINKLAVFSATSKLINPAKKPTKKVLFLFFSN